MIFNLGTISSSILLPLYAVVSVHDRLPESNVFALLTILKPPFLKSSMTLNCISKTQRMFFFGGGVAKVLRKIKRQNKKRNNK